MIKNILEILRLVLKRFNLAILRQTALVKLLENNNSKNREILLLEIIKKENHGLANLFKKSKSQLMQDIFVISELNYKKNGFFVEFGATDGVKLSNTYLMEKEFCWNGILAEPAKCWHESLFKNRTCHIDTSCVWTSSNQELIFNEVEIAELSTIKDFQSNDEHKFKRTKCNTYSITTLSLVDLLKKYNAPSIVDYLSIDTEGSEYKILESFDFDKYKFNVITCEHNYTAAREKIYSLLTSKGYVRKYQNISEFDDWYVYSGNENS